jgi:hypothetical protein
MDNGNASEENKSVEQPKEVTRINEVDQTSKALSECYNSSPMSPVDAYVSPPRG